MKTSAKRYRTFLFIRASCVVRTSRTIFLHLPFMVSSIWTKDDGSSMKMLQFNFVKHSYRGEKKVRMSGCIDGTGSKEGAQLA